jgi:hypothetical protein
LEKFLSIIKVCNIIKLNLGVFVKHISLEHLNKVSIGSNAIRIAIFKEGLRLLLFRQKPRLIVGSIFVTWLTSSSTLGSCLFHLRPYVLNVRCHTSSIISYVA